MRRAGNAVWGIIKLALLVCFVLYGFREMKARYFDGGEKKPSQVDIQIANTNEAVKDLSPQSIKETIFYTELSDHALETPGTEVGTILERRVAQDDTMFPVALKWLRENSLEQPDVRKFNSFYLLMYSDLLRRAALSHQKRGDQANFQELEKASIASLLFFDMLMAVDMARCENKSASSVRPELLDFRYKSHEPHYGLIETFEMWRFRRTAGELDAKYAQRPPNSELCPGGKYIDDIAWNTARETVREQVKKTWEKRFP